MQNALTNIDTVYKEKLVGKQTGLKPLDVSFAVGANIKWRWNKKSKGGCMVPLPLTLVDEAAGLMARAFFHDPLYGFFFPRERTRLAEIRCIVLSSGLISAMHGRALRFSRGWRSGRNPMTMVSIWGSGQ